MSTGALRLLLMGTIGITLDPLAVGMLSPWLQRCMLNTLLRLEDVQWSRANGTSDQLKVAGCRLRQYSVAEARRCLAGKRLVVLGDSVTR